MFTFLRLLALALILTLLRPMALGSDAAMAQTATSSDTASPVRRALLIGVNEYRSKKVSDLKGAVNDVELAKLVLTTSFGFSEKNIETLTNEQATRKGILSAFERLTCKRRCKSRPR